MECTMVEIEAKGEMTRTEVASFLRKFADELEGDGTVRDRDDRGTGGGGDRQPAGDRDTTSGGRSDADPPRNRGDEARSSDTKQITFVVGGESATVTVPETFSFDVDVESRSPLLSSGKRQEIDLQLSWEVEEPEHGDDTIEMV